MLDSLMRVLVMETIRAVVWNAAALVPISYGVWLQARLKRK
jgi:hypothetical protein